MKAFERKEESIDGDVVNILQRPDKTAAEWAMRISEYNQLAAAVAFYLLDRKIQRQRVEIYMVNHLQAFIGQADVGFGVHHFAVEEIVTGLVHIEQLTIGNYFIEERPLRRRNAVNVKTKTRLQCLSQAGHACSLVVSHRLWFIRKGVGDGQREQR